jgi:hypothetical protein
MAIQLNSNSPRPHLTEQLVGLGLSFGSSYTVHWSQVFSGQWDIKDCQTKQVVLTLQAWKVDELLKSKVLIPRAFLSK